MLERIAQIYFRLQIIAFVMGLAWFLWQHPLLLLAALGIAAAVVATVRKEKIRRKTEGYWIEYVSPGLLGDGRFALIYHEVRGDIVFTGEGTVQFPTPNTWPTKVPSWAKNQRQLIKERLYLHFPRLCEAPEQRNSVALIH